MAEVVGAHRGGGFDFDADDIAASVLEDGVDLDPVLGAVWYISTSSADQVRWRASSISTNLSSNGPNRPLGRSMFRTSAPTRFAARPESTKATFGIIVARLLGFLDQAGIRLMR
nr:hypothetical protein [Nocardia acididurans]